MHHRRTSASNSPTDTTFSTGLWIDTSHLYTVLGVYDGGDFFDVGTIPPISPHDPRTASRETRETF